VRKIQVTFIMLALAALGAAQTSNVPNYENHNMIDYGPLVFKSISGVVVDPAGVAMPGASVTVFTDTDHKPVANTITDAKGSFTFPHISPGSYRVVAHFDGLCPANVPVRIVTWPHGRVGQRLVIHAISGAIDTCSYGAYK
jgi:protocatechuate 3,4-dioxygenase beta subunit